MKKLLFATTLIVGMMVMSCKSDKVSTNVKLQNALDSMSYVMGLSIGENIFKTDSTLNIDALCRGIKQQYTHQATMTLEEAKTYYLSYVNYVVPAQARKYENEFLEQIVLKNRSYARTASGVTYTVSDVGNSEKTAKLMRDTVVINYSIESIDGKELFSTYADSTTLRSALSDLLPGVMESVKLVGEGGNIDAWLPAKCGYGESGNEEMGIKPNSTLLFKIEVEEVVSGTTGYRSRTATRF